MTFHSRTLLLVGGAIAAVGIVSYLTYVLAKKWYYRPRSKSRAPLRIGMPKPSELGLSDEVGRAFFGFMTDVMNEVGRLLGRGVVLEQVSVKNFEDGLRKKDVDVMILDGDASINHSPDIEILACQTTALNSLALVFWDKMPHHVQSLQDFAYYPYNSTAVMRGSLEEHFISMYETIRTERVDTMTNLVVQLKLGLVRAGLIRIDHAHCLKREYGNLKYVPVSLQKRCVMQHERLAILRQDQDLAIDLERTLSRMRSRKVISQMYDKWFGN